MEIEKLDYTQADILAHELIKIAQSYIKTHTPEEVEKIIWETYIFAREAHGTQIRTSDLPVNSRLLYRWAIEEYI